MPKYTRGGDDRDAYVAYNGGGFNKAMPWGADKEAYVEAFSPSRGPGVKPKKGEGTPVQMPSKYFPRSSGWNTHTHKSPVTTAPYRTNSTFDKVIRIRPPQFRPL